MPKEKRMPEVLADEERKALLQSPDPRTPTGLRNHCIMLLMFNAGLRVAEVQNLKVNDIDWNTGKLFLRDLKKERGRTLWIGENDLEVLSRWRERRPEQTGLLFTTLKGGSLNDRYIRAMIKREALSAGIEKDVHPHMLRHTFAKDIYRETGSIKLTQKVLGHANASTTMVYTEISDETDAEDMKNFVEKRGKS